MKRTSFKGVSSKSSCRSSYALVVVESRRVSGRHHSLLSLWDVLQEERLVSLKIGVVIDLKENESL